MESAVFQRLKKSRPKRLLSAPLSRHSPSAPGYCKFYGLMVDPFAGCDLINSSACRLRLISIKTRVSSLTRVNLCVRSDDSGTVEQVALEGGTVEQAPLWSHFSKNNPESSPFLKDSLESESFLCWESCFLPNSL